MSAAFVTQDPTTTTERIQAGTAVHGGDWHIINLNPETGQFRLRLRTFVNFRKGE